MLQFIWGGRNAVLWVDDCIEMGDTVNRNATSFLKSPSPHPNLPGGSLSSDGIQHTTIGECTIENERRGFVLFKRQGKVFFHQRIPFTRRNIVIFFSTSDVVGDEAFVVEQVQSWHRGEEDNFC